MKLRPAVFIDKDGTLVEDVPYNVDPERIQLADGAGRALLRLSVAGYAIVIVSNQSGVARGYFAEDALHSVHQRTCELLARWAAPIAGFYWCPHHPEGSVAQYTRACDCRKPEPGLLVRASRDLGIDLQRSWMVGDILDDIEAGRRADCRTILLDNGNETEWRRGPLRTPDRTATCLPEVADIIVRTGLRPVAQPSIEAVTA